MDKSTYIPGAPEREATPVTVAEFKSQAQLVLNALKGWQFVRERHGSLYDRGAADSYYGRPRDPHYGGVGGDSGPRVDQGLSIDEIKEYYSGYEYNEQYGDKKRYD